MATDQATWVKPVGEVEPLQGATSVVGFAGLLECAPADYLSGNCAGQQPIPSFANPVKPAATTGSLDFVDAFVQGLAGDGAATDIAKVLAGARKDADVLDLIIWLLGAISVEAIKLLFTWISEEASSSPEGSSGQINSNSAFSGLLQGSGYACVTAATIAALSF